MAERKEIRKYVFSVEGDTEKWYLEWLCQQLNAFENTKYRVLIVAEVQKNPLKFAKRLNTSTTPKVTHLCDMEGETPTELREFENVLHLMKQAQKNKRIEYDLGYSNLSFELWMILHKSDCRSPLPTKKQYLTRINRAFGKQYENLDQYKEERNFKSCLQQLTLHDVLKAIQRSKALMNAKQENGSTLSEYAGYKYYPDNPALTVYQNIEAILRECEILECQSPERQQI